MQATHLHCVAHGYPKVAPQGNACTICLRFVRVIERTERVRKLPSRLRQQQREDTLGCPATGRLMVAAVHENILTPTVGVKVAVQ